MPRPSRILHASLVLLVALPLATGTLAHPAGTGLATTTDAATGGAAPDAAPPVATAADPWTLASGAAPGTTPPAPVAGGNAITGAGAGSDPAEHLRWFGLETADRSRAEAAPLPTRVDDDGPGGSNDITFVCPEPPHGLPVQPTTATSDMVIYGCPFLVRDGQYSLGNAAIVVDHAAHNMVAFSSLHGGASDGTPYPHSRGHIQVHTTLTSTSQGLEWSDQPPGPSYEPSEEARGTDTDIVMDDNGNVYGVYLYHQPVADDRFDSLIHAFKAGPVSQNNVVTSYAYKAVLTTRDDGNRIERIHLEHLPGAAPHANAPPANESAPSADDHDVGQVANPGHDVDARERIVALWHETARDGANGTTGLAGWIDAAWTTTSAENTWHRLPDDQVIGPCSAGSNGIQRDGKLYVACVVDRGYADRARARIGDIDLWEIDVFANTTKLVGFTGMTTGGEVLLAQAHNEKDTYVGLLSWDRIGSDDDLERLEVEAGYAWLNTLKAPGGQLSINGVDLGIQLRNWGQGGDDLPLLDAHVTAFEITDDTYQSLLVYKEWHDEPQGVPEIGPETDPLALVDNRFTDYNKYLMAFNACDGPIAGYEAQLGTAVDNYNAQQYAENTGIFNEPRDGLFKTREPDTREELVYFALGDYGAMQYGALILHDQSSFCAPPPIPPIAPAAVTPQALTTATGASHVMAASFAVPAAAMIGYLLTVKRRSPMHAAAED